MRGLGLLWLWQPPLQALCSVIVSFVLALFSQLALAGVTRALDSVSLVAVLPVSGLVFVLTIMAGRWWRRCLGVSASAPSFVLFNVIFLWGVYLSVIRKAISLLLDAVLNAECALLLFGLCWIFSGDPGIVSYDASFLQEPGRNVLDIFQNEKLPSLSRVRHCKSCKAYIRGLDHHCPAFGNCIGQKNLRLFVTLLTGFIIAESTYTICCAQYITSSISTGNLRKESTLSLNLVISTMMFSVLQVIWQVIFLAWNIYCICFNIKTDEWVNWKKYPEFQVQELPQAGNAASGTEFFNPYDKGFVFNILEFLKATP